MRVGFLLLILSWGLVLVSASKKIRPDKLKLLGPAEANGVLMQGKRVVRAKRKGVSFKASMVFSAVGGHILTLPLALYLTNLCISDLRHNFWLVAVIQILMTVGAGFEFFGSSFMEGEPWDLFVLTMIRLAITTYSYGGGFAFFLKWNGPLALAAALAAYILVFLRIK